MKKIILAIALATLSVGVTHAAETKKVCEIVKDSKTQKEKEVCKNIKVHKKLNGTTIPEKNK
jgi:hypothetical protein